MKIRLGVFAIALGMLAPLFASAQSVSNGPTREQVLQEANQYAAAGFNPARANPRTWVDDAQAASREVAGMRTAAQPTSHVAFGGDAEK
ncbi:DUF4148 domain-containing protein [Burkholderia cenocepacia]|uniref:DUF4148 domain-containing protein n=1 Tax=Burkholderia cenocepacia TaxID=95486 RepID=UPI00244655FE|nr:DUF4148 domain-containing protein [Burkholderia cenocepacia]